MKKRRGRTFQHPQNKGCIIRATGIEEINYKDVEFLKKFISEKGFPFLVEFLGLFAIEIKNKT